MPAASYREGPDGHSSRKQNSKRRRAKCSPSFVSGRVIGHGDISPRCIPECSAMARCTAPYPLLAPAAPALCLSCFWRGRSPSPAFGAVFMRGGRQLFGAGRIQAFVHGKIFANAFSGDWQWQYTRAVRSRALDDGKMPVKCVPGRLAMARLRPDAFPGGNPWQVLRSMHPESGLGRENRQFAARFARHASEMSWLWQDMRAMHPKSPANSRLGIHRAKILPGRGAFRCTGPSNHARRADLAIRRGAKPPERPQPRCRRTV